MDWEKYQDAYQKASPTLQELLGSERIPLCVRNSLEKRGLLSLRKKAAAEIAAYTVGVQTIDETVKNLAQFGIVDALQFVAEIQTCINQPMVSSAITQQSITPLQAEISIAEEELASLQTIRTMAGDAAATLNTQSQPPVYQSSQEHILARPTIPSVPPSAPTPPPPNTQRWGSE